MVKQNFSILLLIDKLISTTQMWHAVFDPLIAPTGRSPAKTHENPSKDWQNLRLITAVPEGF
jgi:hypothetical protein